MITKRHNISIVVNGTELELESQDKINLRINNTIYNPEKVSVTQSEYSFSFNVPMTPNNNRTFGFANIPSVKGKFVRQFNAYVYADGIEIFKGLLRISSIGDENYKCNLISVKNNSIDEIFGESKMNEILWEVPYNGASTQNAKNQEDSPDFFFPLVCYGAFQKQPYLSINSDDNELNYYTSLTRLDKYVKYYNETFIPSPNLIEIIKRMIEQKGYTYSGDVFTDDLISKLYLSSHIASEQDPAYNLGGKRGKLNVSFNYKITEQQDEPTLKNYNGAFERELTYPENVIYLLHEKKYDKMGEDNVLIYDLFDEDSPSYSTVTQDNDNMWENGFIVIPHDGYYKITMDLSLSNSSTDSTVKDSYPSLVSNSKDMNELIMEHITYTRPMDFDYLAYDIQLVKNNSIELEYIAGNAINISRNPIAYDDRIYKLHAKSDYPHELPPYSIKNLQGRFTGPTEYYRQKPSKTRGYDPKVNENFVMGMSTAAGAWGVIKKGKSWDNSIDYYGYNSYQCDGYLRYEETNTTSYSENTDYQKISANGIPQCTYNRLSEKSVNGKGYAVVWLKKNDILSLKLMHKAYKWYSDKRNEETYKYNVPPVTASGKVTIEAMSPHKKDLDRNWSSSNVFGTNLNLGEFLSKEENQKDFFNNFLTTFNLSCNISGKNIDINKNVASETTSEAVCLDDRINVNDVETEVIDFPTSVNVQWTIDKEESGFYHSVSDEHINDDDWKNWGDIGSEKVELVKNYFNNNDISKTSKFSYNWWMPFTLHYYHTNDNIDSAMNTECSANPIDIMLPIIAKDEDFIDGGNYDEMMKKDGRSLKQRLWFKGDVICSPNTTNAIYVPNSNGAKFNYKTSKCSPVLQCKEFLMICPPERYYEGSDVLNYTRDKNSLLMRYFNINENTDSNYATIEVYLTPQEYIRLRNGAMVRFDNDRYRICSITGYDPCGGNKTKLKLMKL